MGAVTLCLCLSAVTGCTFTDAYTGPFRSPDEVAILTGQARLVGNQGHEDTYINSIDGQRAIGGWTAPSREVHVLPGLHAIGLVKAKVIEAAAASGSSWPWSGSSSDEEFRDEAVLRFKVIVGARYALGYNPTTKQFVAVRVGLGPVPFEVVK